MSELLHTIAPYELLHLMVMTVFLVDLVNVEIKFTKRQGQGRFAAGLVCACACARARTLICPV